MLISSLYFKAEGPYCVFMIAVVTGLDIDDK